MEKGDLWLRSGRKWPVLDASIGLIDAIMNLEASGDVELHLTVIGI